MPKYDVTDEGIINGSPDVVYNAVIDEANGKTSWWLPHLSSRLRTGDSYGRVGAVVDMTVFTKPSVKFAAKTVEVKKNELIRVNYVGGAFRGEGLWRFEDLGGKTKVSFRWRTDLSGLLMHILGPFFPVAKNHSAVMKGAFNGLNKFLAGKS